MTTPCQQEGVLSGIITEQKNLREDFNEMKGTQAQFMRDFSSAVDRLTNELTNLRLEISPVLRTTATVERWVDRVLWGAASALLVGAMTYVKFGGAP
jgi:hypothetical protein